MLMILLIIIPIPTFVLDMLLVVNMGISMVIFLQAMFIESVLEFSILPTLLIFTTLLRIVLNVCSARLILGSGKAGQLISAVGEFSINGNYVVGIIMYIIIIIAMFLVITKGAERISEVGARFKLDSMPGKQMAIEGELNSGAIDAAEAKKRRQQLQTQMDFYGAMDGASKYIRGDAVVNLIITIINILGGLIIGMLQNNMSLTTAASTYSILSIGDGLVNQIPSILVTSAAAVLITKNSDSMDTSEQLFRQLFSNPKSLKIAAYILYLLSLISLVGIIPHMPFLALLSFATILLLLSRHRTSNEIKIDSKKNDEKVSNNIRNKPVNSISKVSIEFGEALNPVMMNVERNQLNSKLVSKINKFKDSFFKEYGVKLSDIKVSPDEIINPNECIIKIRDNFAVSFTAKSGFYFAAVYNDDTKLDYGNEEVIDCLDLRGYWIPKDKCIEAESKGAFVYSIYDILYYTLRDSIINNIDKILTRQDIQDYKEHTELISEALIEELNNKKIENSMIKKVLQNLLLEGISIKDSELILESICDCYAQLPPEAIQKLNANNLVQYVRSCMVETLSKDNVENGILKVIILSNNSRDIILKRINNDNSLELEKALQNLLINIKEITSKLKRNNVNFVYAVEDNIRLPFFKMLNGFNINTKVLSYNEFPKNITIQKIQEI